MQRPLTSISSFVLALLILSGVAQAKSEVDIADLTAEQIYAKGKLLFNQHKYTEAKPYLEAAIENGYSGAALMYADTAYKSMFIQTKEENKYLVKAAEMGSIVGMMRAGGERSLSLNSKEWEKKAVSLLRRQADKGDALAMRLFHMGYTDADDDSWLVKAAKAGDPLSQLRLAKDYENGDGWFLIPGKREKEIERLYKAASDAGYHPAMRGYAFRLKKQGKLEQSNRLFDLLLEKGDADTISTLAFVGTLDSNAKNLEDEFKLDPAIIPAKTLIQSAAYYQIYFASIGGEKSASSHELKQSRYNKLLAVLTAPQKQQADKKATEYLKTHTVYFQDDLGEYEYTLDSIRTQ